MIGIVDYGMGNLGSVKKAFDYLSIKSFVSSDKELLKKADKIVLPGVGAFEDAMNNINKYDLTNMIRSEINNNKPFLGICLGLQLLFDYSEEGDKPAGLGIIKGGVKKFDTSINLKIPHIGWNNINSDNCPLLNSFDKQYFYFVHSYYVDPTNDINCSYTTYGKEFISAIEEKNILATQFHPEKSGEAGLALLKNWAKV
ncbi:MAG: imidazole glycerol phosphate synthase subunit HisH [Clostridiales bacterium]|nr:imidazole glycerol phosphate synthase subunit HisH [Clostridiales bacterium]